MSPRPFLLSIVTPAYRCEACIEELYRRVVEAVGGIPGASLELIFVNDGSPERDWEVISRLADLDPRVKGINLSRNFGQHHAIAAGMDHAQGDWIAVMDCDLQDQPEEIPRLFEHAWKEGWDVVFARRMDRQDTWLKVSLSRCFNRLVNTLSSLPIDPAISNFSIVTRQVADSYRRMRECSRSYGLGILWCGYKVGYVPVRHGSRFAGASAYSFGRSLQLAMESITSLSNKPLRMAINLGFGMATLAFLYGIYLIIRYLFWAIPVAGWTTITVSLYFLSGVILVVLGILGLYLGKVFDEVKARPIYLVRETRNVDGTPKCDQANGLEA